MIDEEKRAKHAAYMREYSQRTGAREKKIARNKERYQRLKDDPEFKDKKRLQHLKRRQKKLEADPEGTRRKECEVAKTSYHRNRNQNVTKSKARYHNNIPYYRENRRRNYETNRDHDLAKRKSERLAIKTEVLTHYGPEKVLKCSLCPEARLATLTIDHIAGDGAEHRRKIKRGGGDPFYMWLKQSDSPEGYRTLCINCNHRVYVGILAKKEQPADKVKQRLKARRASRNLKVRFMAHLGGCCKVCGETDIMVLSCHHINNDGAEHRRRLGLGKIAGTPFYGKVIKSGDFTELECRCLNCNCAEEWESCVVESKME